VIKGVLFLLSSAIGFAASTAFAKIVTRGSQVQAVEITFFRFLLGLGVVSLFVIKEEKSLRPNNIKYILLRAVFNTAAVIFFFLGVQHTTITKANLLNMTYPIFVFLLSPFINREKTSMIYFLFLLCTMAGLYLVVIPQNGLSQFSQINAGDTYALISGILAAFAITSLREARKHDSSYIILFYLMLIGTVCNALIVVPCFIIPRGMILFYVILSALFAVLGQIFITVGYKYIDAAAGSLISSSRIIFALLLGVIFLSEELNARIMLGGTVIIISLFGVSGIWKKWVRQEKAATGNQ
jgi:drug/metabolite transporter (DMT)-like permease